MNFNVPQFIEVEDKIAFQMTAKQLGWYALGGFILFFVWNFFSQGAFIAIAILVLIICSAFAFLRLSGMSLFNYIISSIRFLVKPKVMVWHREAKATDEVLSKPQKESRNKELKINRVIKEKNLKKSSDLADILDKQSDI